MFQYSLMLRDINILYDILYICIGHHDTKCKD